VKLTIDLHLVQRLRMRGAVPPLPHYVLMAWYLLKHRDNTTFTFCFKCEGKRPLGRYKHRWEGIIGSDLREKRWDVVNWIHVAQNRDQWRVLVKTIMGLLFP
jgi:hypothetical protein